MKLKKVILPCGQIYLNVYMFRNDMKYRYIGIDFKFNTDVSCYPHVFSTGLVTHFSDFFSDLLMSFCHFVFRMGFFQLLQTTDLKKAEVSGSQIFFKIGVLKNFILFTRKHLCWSPEG